MTGRQALWQRTAAATGLLILATALGCSSPTAPTAPPTATPPPTSSPSPPSPSTPPLALSCPQGPTVASPNSAPVPVSYAAPIATGGLVGANGVSLATVQCTPASASMFPVGTTEVRCTATSANQTASCSFPVTVTAPVPRLSRTRFLAFGDSMTAGEVSLATASRFDDGRFHRLVFMPAASYPTQLLSQLRARYATQAAQIDVNNAGVSGEWAEDGVRRMPGVLAAFRPEVVLLLQGTNELTALGTPGVQRASRAIGTMAQEVRGRGARLFLATLPPGRPTGTRAYPAALTRSLNSLIRTTARSEGAVLVDLYEGLSADVTRYIGLDGLHPTEAGYARIAELFAAAIRAELETTQ